MGIEEFVLARAERIGEKKGMEKGIEQGMEKGIEQERQSRNAIFVQTLLKETDFDDEKIAGLVSVTPEFVQQVRQSKRI